MLGTIFSNHISRKAFEAVIKANEELENSGFFKSKNELYKDNMTREQYYEDLERLML